MSARHWVLPIALVGVGAVYVAGRLRPRGDDDEPLPGDEILPDATIIETHETALMVPTDAIWPWLVQMGYGRGGFYTFDLLERFAGVGIANANAINPDWQDLSEGDRVHLTEEVSLVVARLDPDSCLVLSSDGDNTQAETGMSFDFSWAFVLASTGSDSCRLIVRERYLPRTPAAARMVRAARPVARLMTHGMLHGLRRRTRV